MLVDSPGIGENSAMDSVITHFVSEHHIMGFIYVIKSDNAGGVDEDRVSVLNLRLLIMCCYNIITCIRRFFVILKINGVYTFVAHFSSQLGNLLKVIIDKQKKKLDDTTTLFDPKCAIFVCNLWDNVKSDEQTAVYDYAVRKLENYWPGLVKTSVIRFSAKRAKAELSLDRDYITKDYKLFLDNLKELLTKATDMRVKSTYK